MVAIKKFDFTAGIKPENTDKLLEDCKNFIGNLKICALGDDAEQGYKLIQRIKAKQEDLKQQKFLQTLIIRLKAEASHE